MNRAVRFRALFQEAYPGLLRYALHRGVASADADDLVAATLEVAWRRLDEVPADDPLPWLYGVARNLIRNWQLQKRRRNALIARLWTLRLHSGAGSSEGLEPGELCQALARLSDKDQEILRMVAWDGLTVAQVAVALGCSPAAVRTRLHRARNRLAVELTWDTRRPWSPDRRLLSVCSDR